MLPDHERTLARYLEEVPAPSVIALNNLAATEATNHFLLAVTGMHADDQDLGWGHPPATHPRPGPTASTERPLSVVYFGWEPQSGGLTTDMPATQAMY